MPDINKLPAWWSFKRPFFAVDLLVMHFTKGKFNGIVLVERKFIPKGIAFPGGFVEYGETAEHAAVREAEEELGLKVKLIKQLGVYSDPKRDKRFHSISVAFLAKTSGRLKAGDDAKKAFICKLNKIPKMQFDHNKILKEHLEDLKLLIK
ncbi:MAG: NUDIX hydrolase [archaeon]